MSRVFITLCSTSKWYFPCSLVKGYNPAPREMRGNLMDSNLEQDTIRELGMRKQVSELWYYQKHSCQSCGHVIIFVHVYELNIICTACYMYMNLLCIMKARNCVHVIGMFMGHLYSQIHVQAHIFNKIWIKSITHLMKQTTVVVVLTIMVI